MQRYLDRIRSDLRRFSAEQLDPTNAAGERLAERLALRPAEGVAGGGRLLIFDQRGPYSAEATGRAGGLMAIETLTGVVGATGRSPLQAKDALIIVSDRPADEADLAVARSARETAALVIGICPVRGGEDALSSACDVALDNYVTNQDAAVTLEGLPHPIAPTSGVLNTAILWTLTAAYIEAMERHGKPPHIWMSIKRLGAAEYNAAALQAAKEAGY